MATDIFVAVVQGVVEGITEFLPISSTGHLVLTGKLLGFEGEKAESFEIFIQLGAILAVLVLYFQRFRSLLEFRGGSGFSGINGLVKLGLACLPACVVGFLFHKAIKNYLFAPGPIAVAFVFGGIVMILLEQRRPAVKIESLEDVTYRAAFLAGVFQCFSLWPGISRAGSMIVGGMILGMARTVAAEFSFLVAVPIMILATLFDLIKSRDILSGADVPMFAVGFIVAFITAILAIRTFIGFLKRYSLVPFGIYRIIAALAIFLYLR